jgi:ankyrin repeat protein
MKFKTTATKRRSTPPYTTGTRMSSNSSCTLLLSRCANPNARNAHGETPLYVAVLVGDAAIVKLLIDAGADVGARENRGYTPLHYTASLFR